MSDTCTYCGNDLDSYENPVFVTQGHEKADDVGQFCHFACLTAYVDDEGLETGNACHWR